jgi:hypothetical protein
MAKKTYKGSCHCGAVRYEADIDFSAGTSKCNCSICWKRRMWATSVKPDAFRLISGKDNLADYQFATKSGHHRFCKTCGVAAFGDGYIEQIGGAFVSINVACLDDLDPADLVQAPIKYMDGRHNNWFNEPAEKRHL